MLFDRRKTLLGRVVEKYQSHAVAAPGAIGNTCTCSALFAEHRTGAENHSESLPRRIAEPTAQRTAA